MTVTVKDGIKALERAIADLKKLDPNQELQGNFDQGGYTDAPMELKEMFFQVDSWDDEDEDEDPGACLTACFYT